MGKCALERRVTNSRRRVVDDLGSRGFGWLAKSRGCMKRWGRRVDDLDRGFGGEAKSQGIMWCWSVVLTTSGEDLVAWQSPEARPVTSF